MRRARLIACSLAFYGWWSIGYLVLLIGWITTNFLFGRWIAAARDRSERCPPHQPDRLEDRGLPDADVGVEERRIRRGDDDVGVDHEMHSAPGTYTVDRGDDRLRYTTVPPGEP